MHSNEGYNWKHSFILGVKFLICLFIYTQQKKYNAAFSFLYVKFLK